MLKKTKLISLILLSGAFVVPAGASAETAPFKQETNISQQNGESDLHRGGFIRPRDRSFRGYQRNDKR